MIFLLELVHVFIISLMLCVCTICGLISFSRDGEISIYDFFSKSHKYRIGKIANKIFAPTVVRNMSEIFPKLVLEDLYLSLSEERKTYYKSCIHSRFERLKGYGNFKLII